MAWPWVSRVRFEDAQKQIAELKETNAKLLELALSKSVPEPKSQDDFEKEEQPQRPHRKLGVDLRREFRAAAELRAAAIKIEKGAK